MNWITNRKAQLGFLVLSLSLLFANCVLQRETPFRGEHWGLLYQTLHAPNTLEAMRRIISFNCFGATRFQPLGFFPTILPFWFFHFSFFFHYLFATVLHLAYTAVFLCLWHGVNHGFTEGFKLRFREYPLEAALFLVLFPSADTINWTFFTYIETACFFGYLSVLYFLKNIFVFNREKAISFFFLAIALLIYEPFLVVFAIYFLVGLWQSLRGGRIQWLNTLLPFTVILSVLPVYLTQYHPSATKLTAVVGQLFGRPLFTGHDVLLATPFAANHIAFCLYNFVLMEIGLFSSLITPYWANKVNLYELALPQWAQGMTLFPVAVLAAMLMLATLLFLKRRWKTRHSPLLLYICSAVPLLMFSLMAWGRNVDGDFPAVQLRYIYTLLPFVLLLTLAGIKEFVTHRQQTVYPTLIAMLILINCGNFLDHALRVRRDMADAARYVAELKAKSKNDTEVVDTMMQAFDKFTIPSREDNLFFTYNARGCLLSFLER